MTICKGIKYKSTHFRAGAEIGDIREDKNEVDIIYTDSDGTSWTERNFNLSHLREYFRTGDYWIPKPDNVNISII